MPFACRCQCGHCVAMDMNRESLCCCELDRVVQKKEENESEVACILPHKPLMLSVFILGLLAGTRLACTDSSGV